MSKIDSNGSALVLNRLLKSCPNLPKILWWQANEILYKIQKQQRRDSERHPCVTTWLKLVQCMRRYPHNMAKRCSGEMSRHYHCTLTNKDWTIKDDVSFIKMLECLEITKGKKRGYVTSQEQIGHGVAAAFSKR